MADTSKLIRYFEASGSGEVLQDLLSLMQLRRLILNYSFNPMAAMKGRNVFVSPL